MTRASGTRHPRPEGRIAARHGRLTAEQEGVRSRPMLARKLPNWLRRYGVLPVVLSSPAQAFSELGVVEPAGERSGEPAGPEQAGVAAGHQVTERDEADQPALHLPGVGLDRQVDVVSGVVGAYGDRTALDVEPALGGARAGQRQVQHGALPRKLGRD